MGSDYRLGALLQLRQAEVERRSTKLGEAGESARGAAQRLERGLSALSQAQEAVETEGASEWARTLAGNPKPSELLLQARWRRAAIGSLSEQAQAVDTLAQEAERSVARVQVARGELTAAKQQEIALRRHWEVWSAKEQRLREERQEEELADARLALYSRRSEDE